jgi:hypothetical protein
MAFRWVIEIGRGKGASVGEAEKSADEAKAPAAPEAGKGEASPQPEEKSGATSVASIGLLITPLLAAMGGLALTGTIGRVQRDYPECLSVAIGMVVLSGVLWVAASNFTAPKADGKRSTLDYVFRSLSLFLAGAGFIVAMILAVETANNEPRPEITTALSESGDEITVTVTVPNLSSTRRLAYQVDLVEQGSIVETIYQAYVGPDSEGNVDQTAVVKLPVRNDYGEIGVTAYTGKERPRDCEGSDPDPNAENGAACVVLAVPGRTGPPS